MRVYDIHDNTISIIFINDVTNICKDTGDSTVVLFFTYKFLKLNAIKYNSKFDLFVY